VAFATTRPDSGNCEAPCCRRVSLHHEFGWTTDIQEVRAIHRAAGAEVRLIEFVERPGADKPVPLVECLAFDVAEKRCAVYADRPLHCRDYDCRPDPSMSAFCLLDNLDVAKVRNEGAIPEV